jgi:hypothetical protein
VVIIEMILKGEKNCLGSVFIEALNKI